jgi:F0F1-type ATP synthase assembly protein I
MNPSRFAREQKKTIVTGILCFVIMLVVLQLWLLTATMNAYLGGDNSVLLPAAIASLVCLLLNGGLLRYVYGLDARRNGIDRAIA